MTYTPTPSIAHSSDVILTDQDNGERVIEILNGPMKFSPDPNYQGPAIPHGTPLAKVWGTGVRLQTRYANALFIVHRINTYEALCGHISNAIITLQIGTKAEAVRILESALAISKDGKS